MARCGCAGTTCNCVVTAGANVTVTGAGTAGNPYVVSANDSTVDVLDTTTIDLTLTPGSPDIISGVVKVDPAAGNLITVTAQGLRVDCATITATCAIGVAVTDTDTVDLTLGPGNNIKADVRVDATTPGNLIKVIPGGAPGGLRVDCSDVVLCFDAGLGISPTALATGLVQVCLSTDGGNALSFGADGCLYAAAGGGTPVTVTDTFTVDLTLTGQDIKADVILDPAVNNLLTASATGLLAVVNTFCGITGTGTLADPLRANVEPTFPFPCTVDKGSDIYCDAATGKLQGIPEHMFISSKMDQPVCNATCNFNSLAPVGAGNTAVGLDTVYTITNPSPCRTMVLEVLAGIQHALISQAPGGGNGRMEMEMAAGVTLSAPAVATTTVQNGHQRWAHSGDINGDRASFDTKGSFGYTYYTLPPGGTTTVTMRASFNNVVNSGGVQATVSGWSNTAIIKGWTI